MYVLYCINVLGIFVNLCSYEEVKVDQAFEVWMEMFKAAQVEVWMEMLH